MIQVRYPSLRDLKSGTTKALLLLSAFGLISCGIYDNNSSPSKQRSGGVPGKVVTVKANENIYSVAQENNASMRDIIMLNGLQAPYTLRQGQTLIMPFKRGDTAPSEMPPPSDALSGAALGGVQQAPLSAVESQPLAPLSVQSAPIATIPSTIAPAPPTPPPAQPFQSPQVNKGINSSSNTVTSAPVEALNTPPPPPPKPVTTIAQTEETPTGISAPVASSSSSAPPMVWPVQGPILSGFGPKGQGVNNDGVNIGAPKGAPVVAAAPGTVVYAGNEMKGFGNLILIRHQGGWVTAYAYLDRMLVTKDAVVAQGDMIGTVGKTGNIATPQLHFETRHEGKVVDPAGIVKAE